MRRHEGAVLEKDMIVMMPAWQSLNLEQMTKSIRGHCVLATDFGQLHHPIPPEGSACSSKCCSSRASRLTRSGR